MDQQYDSSLDTVSHIRRVQTVIGEFCMRLTLRGILHDESKLKDPEKTYIDAFAVRLRDAVYQSEEYKAALSEIQPALAHHYACNTHHPEHFDDGVAGMSLLDLVEMFSDWLSSAERQRDGDIRRSIEINRRRFNLDDQLVRIFQNTVDELSHSIV